MTVSERTEVIPVPEGVTVTIKGPDVKVKGKNGELSRTFVHKEIQIKHETGSIVVHSDLPRRKTAALVGTWAAHIRNMVKGANENFEYKMKICYSHFPIKTKIEADRLKVENFLGERTPRHARIMGATKLKVSGDEILLTGPNVEDVSQTAANIEQACMIRGFDARVFQDGIYITQKGKEA